MALNPTLDADLIRLLNGIDAHLTKVTSPSSAPVPALLADTRLMRDRLVRATEPDTNRSIDTWHKNLFERLASIRERIVRSGDSFYEADDTVDSALMVVELLKARNDAAALLGVIDTMIANYLPDDPSEAAA
ncbi:hypothetical protein [Azospirillum sp. sgz302134]